MKNSKAAILIACVCIFSTVGIQVDQSHAQTPSHPIHDWIYTLRQVHVTDKPTEYLWIVESSGIEPGPLDDDVFRSLESSQLRNWVSALPNGTSILYQRSSLPKIGNVTGDQSDIGDFMRFCQRNRVQFSSAPTL
jgi:hypothetical protein